MGYFTGEERGVTPPQRRTPPRRGGVRVRVRNGTGLGDIYSLIASRVPGYTPPPTTTQTTTAIKLLSTASSLPKIASSFIQPVTPTTTTPTATLPTTFTPTTAPTPVPVTAPVSSGSQPPASQPSDQPAPSQPSGSGGGSTGAGAVAAAAAPIVGALDPMAGAAAALIPAFANAANQPDTTQIRFTGDDASLSPLDALMPDATGGPEVYNADGTPVTKAAKAATFVDKLKALPPAAKVGGAVALYLLFGRR